MPSFCNCGWPRVLHSRPAARAALAALQDVSEDPEIWLEIPLARGHLQYLNNRDVAHYRGDFIDHQDPAMKRHLLRTWHRDSGAPSYDG